MLDRKKQQQIRKLNHDELQNIIPGLQLIGSAGRQQEALADLDTPQREFVQHWYKVIERNDHGLALEFIRQAPLALASMSLSGVEQWLLLALEQYDQRGLGWAVDCLKKVTEFAAEWQQRDQVAFLHQQRQLLATLVTGLGGRELQIDAAEHSYTDSATIYLPASINCADSCAENAQVYKALVVHHWAQTWYGTWQAPILEILIGWVCDDPRLAVFAALERLRVDACLARDFPGIYRLMLSLQKAHDAPQSLNAAWRRAEAMITRDYATVSDSLGLAEQLYQPPQASCYHGVFRPQQVQKAHAKRIPQQRRQLRLMLGRLEQQAQQRAEKQATQALPRVRKPSEGFSLSEQEGATGGAVMLKLQFEQQTVLLPTGAEQLLTSIAQDFGTIPEHYLRPGGQKPYDPEAATEAGNEKSSYTAPEEYRFAENAYRYQEWDYARQRYRPAFCLLREHAIEPVADDFVQQTLEKYHGLLKSIRRSFESILGASRSERRQVSGDDVDFDALVAARVELCRGEELPAAIYTQRCHNSRSIAVIFMVDMSGSTKGWVNQAEREALVLLCEALQTIGDEYAIYGFSGRTHRRVDMYAVKQFSERYDDTIKARISGIKPRAYTRMGAPLRHLGQKFSTVAVRHKLLITLSDGKPEDYGSYYGKYGIEDTRQALLELRRAGISPFCITIDKEAGDYLPYMYGAANYVCLDEVTKLPLKVADIYRKLTT